MKTILALAATSLLALSAPAFAQSAGAPGATGANGCGLSGSNPGTCMNNGFGDNFNSPPNGYYRNDRSYMNEGRAAAPDYEPTGPDSPPMYGPHRDGDLQVGPRSNMDGPADGNDDAR